MPKTEAQTGCRLRHPAVKETTLAKVSRVYSGSLDHRSASGHSGTDTTPPVAEWGILADQVGIPAAESGGKKRVVESEVGVDAVRVRR